jgi:hypothetical protein
MSIWPTYKTLQTNALQEFGDIVVSATILTLPTGDPLKLRLDISDGSLLDVYLSISGRYSYHWERRLTPSGDLYRHDNAPHAKWSYVETFPKHFHAGNESNVVASTISDNPHEALREFLTFVRYRLLRE